LQLLCGSAEFHGSETAAGGLAKSMGGLLTKHHLFEVRFGNAMNDLYTYDVKINHQDSPRYVLLPACESSTVVPRHDGGDNEMATLDVP
jgi:hypothetical protein